MSSSPKLKAPVLLNRQGARLNAGHHSWQMHGVYGPLLETPLIDGQEFFRIETTDSVLLVSRAQGESGMRRLYLWSVEDI